MKIAAFASLVALVAALPAVASEIMVPPAGGSCWGSTLLIASNEVVSRLPTADAY